MSADRAALKWHQSVFTESIWKMFQGAPWTLRFVDIGDVSVAHDQLSIRARRESFSEKPIQNMYLLYGSRSDYQSICFHLDRDGRWGGSRCAYSRTHWEPIERVHGISCIKKYLPIGGVTDAMRSLPARRERFSAKNQFKIFAFYMREDPIMNQAVFLKRWWHIERSQRAPIRLHREPLGNVSACPWTRSFLDIGPVSDTHNQLSIRTRRECFSEKTDSKYVTSIWKKHRIWCNLFCSRYDYTLRRFPMCTEQSSLEALWAVSRPLLP